MSAPNPLIRPYGAAAVAEAATRLRAGGLVAVPTETVYGLAADATSAEAVARIYAAKGRPSFNPLIVHVPDLAAAERIERFDAGARALAAAFWPGPLTLVLPLREGAGIAALVTAGLATVAVRVPAHRAMQAVLAAFGGPLAAPSANRSGAISPTRAAHVAASLGAAAGLVLDDGATEAGLESTIVAPGAPPRLLRPGPVTAEAAAAVLGQELAGAGAGISAPGMLASHYAPAKPLRLAATAVQPMVMVLHELASNAFRHGSLSRPGGQLRVSWQPRRREGEGGTLRLRWEETGGPGLVPPAQSGFGSRVIAATVRGQLGGTLAFDWTADGMVCDITIPLARWLTDAGALHPEVGAAPP